MSVRHTHIFDTASELTYTASAIDVITTIDDPTLEDPFISGTVITSGAAAVVNSDTTSGYVTNPTFQLVVSGEPYASVSGEMMTFDFTEPRPLHSMTVYQNADNYAVSYSVLTGITGATDTIIDVADSTNSGNIYHEFAYPVETRYVGFNITEINPNLNTYHILEVSGEAKKAFTEIAVASTDVTSLTATTNVEPVAYIHDDDSLTFWQSNNSYPQDVIWQFGSTVNISSFSYVSEDATTYPTDYTLSVSQDGTTYTVINTTTSYGSTIRTITFSPTHAAKYLKWTITGGNDVKVRIREVAVNQKAYQQLVVNEIKQTKTLTDQLPGAPGLSATSESGANVVGNLIYGTAGSWQTANVFTLTSGGIYTGSEYVMVSFSDDETLDNITVEKADSLGIPVDFIVAGSADNASYTTIKTFTGNRQTSIDIDLTDSTNTYRFYRILFTASTDAYVKLDTMRFYTRAYATEAKVTLPEIMTDDVTSIGTTVTESTVLTGVKCHLIVDKKSYWFNGSVWATSDGTLSQSNDLTVINNNIESLSIPQNAKIAIAPVFFSSGENTAILTSAEIVSSNLPNADFVPQNQVRIRGYVAGHTTQPLEMHIHLRRSVIVIDGQTIGYTARVITSDSTGYFDFYLPQTELASPKKARFVIRIPSLSLRRERYTPAQDNLDLAAFIAGTF